MIQMNFSPYMANEIKRRQEELYKEMEQLRLANEINRAESSKVQAPSKVLARIGKQLVKLGANLEQQYGHNSVEPSAFGQQNSPEGCS